MIGKNEFVLDADTQQVVMATWVAGRFVRLTISYAQTAVAPVK